jgi:NDP-sugar pyrophosphorylase family protein
MDAVILAGGKGTRLRPYTISIPKPLVPLGEVPIVEILLQQLSLNGIKHAHIAVGYLAELLEAYFSQVNNRCDIEILFLHEKFPLGTIGPIKNIQGLNEKFLLLNGDILTTMPFRDLINFHEDHGAIATLAVHNRTVNIDYGVIEVSPDCRILSHNEKPSFQYKVGMGICVLEPQVMDYIPLNVKFDVPDLIKRLIEDNQKIIAYRIYLNQNKLL